MNKNSEKFSLPFGFVHFQNVVRYYAECHYAEYHYAECYYVESNYAECHYAECCHSKCHYAECHYAECYYAECRGAKEASVRGEKSFITLWAGFERRAPHSPVGFETHQV